MNKKINEHARAIAGEDTILRRVMEALKTLVPLEYTIEPAPDVRALGYDHIVRGKVSGADFVWCIEAKARLTKAAEIQALIAKNKAPNPFLLATEYVPPEAAIRLRDGGIQFIDTVGNAFINQPPLFIFVKGNRPEKDEPAVLTARLFKGAGLRVVYLLLCRPDLVNRPYRELTRMADVALGTANNTIAELIQKGFILDMGKTGKKLLGCKALFDRWIAAYPDSLKPKLLLGRFRGDGQWWKDAHMGADVAQWGGGEVAAAKLTGYLKPGTATLYADRNRLADLVIENRLKKDTQGEVEVLERFWHTQDGFGEGENVHPILIYADLVAIGDQRTMEAARMIYEQHLDRYFGQN